MPTSIYFNCPGCNARIKAPLQFLGTYHNCPGCKTRVMVRSQPRQDAGSLPARDEPARQVSAFTAQSPT